MAAHTWQSVLKSQYHASLAIMAERWIGIQIAALTVADARELVAKIQSGLLAWR